jgi:calcium-dependent protein kinase
MGVCGSSNTKKDQEVSNPIPKKDQPKKMINSTQDFNMGHSNIVSENKNSFEKEYAVQGGSIGAGGYAKVFKVVHRETGQLRAAKLIKREPDCSQEEFTKMIKEVEILKQLVASAHLGPP